MSKSGRYPLRRRILDRERRTIDQARIALENGSQYNGELNVQEDEAEPYLELTVKAYFKIRAAFVGGQQRRP